MDLVAAIQKLEDVVRARVAELDANPLREHVHFKLPRERSKDMTIAQVGWLGQSGSVYALDDPPRGGREPGSYSPLYIQIGTWEHLGDGRYGIND